AGFFYGGAEIRLAKGAITALMRAPAVMNRAVRSLKESYKIAHATSQAKPLKEAYKAVNDSAKIAKKAKVEANAVVAKRISEGHGYRKHVVKQREWGDVVQTKEDYYKHIQEILN